MEKYNRLTVVSFYKEKKYGCNRTMVNCVCDCGNNVKKLYSEVKSGHIKSCGCLVKDMLVKRNITHGMSDSPVHKTYHSMLKRCYDEKHRAYKWYGGRGIKVCEEWKKDFVSFHNWALSNGYKQNLSLDRIDNNGDYRPENCRWETKHNQHRNRSDNVMIGNEIHHDFLTRISKENNIPFPTVRYRYYSIKKRDMKPTEDLIINYHKVDGRRL